MTNHDIFTRVSNNQSLVGLASAVSSSINLLANGTTPRIAGRDIGPGTDTVFRVHITQSFDAGAGNLTISWAFASDEALTVATFIPALTIPNGALVLGREFDVPIPTPGLALIGPTLTRFVGLKYVPQAAPATGALSAWVPLGDSPGVPRIYQRNYRAPLDPA